MHGTRGVVFPLVAGLVGVALSGLLASQAVPSMPPAAPVRPVTETLHGAGESSLAIDTAGWSGPARAGRRTGPGRMQFWTQRAR